MKVIFTIWNLKKEVYKWKLIFQENYVGNWSFDWKSWIVDFIPNFNCEIAPQNNFCYQNFSVDKTF